VAAAARRGLQLALVAFVLYVSAQVIPLLVLPHVLLGVAAAAVLFRDARRSGPGPARMTAMGLGLVLGGMLGILASNSLASRALDAGALALWDATLWPRMAAEIAVAGGFYALAAPLAGARSRILLGLAFGAAVATSIVGVAASLGPADALVAEGRALAADPSSEAYRTWVQDAFLRFLQATESATLAKATPYILFSWAYATILGRLGADDTQRPSMAP